MNYTLKAYLIHDIGHCDKQEDAFFPPMTMPCHFDGVQREDAFFEGVPHTDLNHNIADSRKKQFAVLLRSLERYQLYVRLTRPHMKKYCLNIREIDSAAALFQIYRRG